MRTGVARLTALVLVWPLLLAAPARAHEDDGADGTLSGAAHAREDLAGEPMSRIERDTAAAAREPAAVRTLSLVRRVAQQQADAVSDAPAVSGRWSAPVPLDVVPVFTAVLPSGRVLMWDSVGDGAVDDAGDSQTFTRALVLDPATNTSRRVDLQGFNIFCAGYAQLPNGDVLVAGGNKDHLFNGIEQTHLFHWRTETWSRGPDMGVARWYPAVTALANGEAVIVGGGPDVAQVYQTNRKLRYLTGFTSFAERVYAFLVPRVDGRVEMVGPRDEMATMDTDGAGTLDATHARDGIDRDYGSFAAYRPDKVLVTGGGDLTEGGAEHVPTRTSVVVDTSGTGTTTTTTGSMAYPRRQHNLTVLPDGSVLATGGMRRSVDHLVDLSAAVFAAERWSPTTGTWTTLASAAKVREYHSTATLLPDGRVMTGGGGICKTCVNVGYLEKNVEYFSPPYLFAADGTAAVRPRLTKVPATVRPGSTFSLRSPAASTIRSMALVRLGAPTHSTDAGQRYVPLSFTTSGTTVTVSAPADQKVAPPGYYMLFAVNDKGVPSVAPIVRVGAPSTFVVTPRPPSRR
ncbi:hypothetical protein GCM10011519_24570 [Marmoricola endophyticus]|uniref:Galactose oxidase-like Early set domain-containing protein n=1 Tax=Marmoricola endophyticus TaxID=2040280 RepID=A0A917F5C7_9ACTN|nr:galactose oxidase early set domain-containing protein [Marmoricola endophyticus]GGF49704.1 hypothetical protein GCM10011519_24570 [Marmoricola endophyticus]